MASQLLAGFWGSLSDILGIGLDTQPSHFSVPYDYRRASAPLAFFPKSSMRSTCQKVKTHFPKGSESA
jgi:hypothetical protein